MEQRAVVAAETISVLLMCLAYATRLHTVVWTRIHSEQLGRRVWISQTTGLSKLLESEQTWYFLHPRKALVLRPNDQSCHHETWLHLDFVDWSNKWSNQDYYDGNIRLKE